MRGDEWAMFKMTIVPRFGDADALGHINNTVAALWFETARRPIFELFCPDLVFSIGTFPFILAHADYDFVGELFFRHEVEIRTGIARIGTKSFTIRHEAWQEGRLGVKGNAVVACYDFASKRTVPVPDDKRALLAAHLIVDADI
ncbi:MAG: acyl-CoA thioesterase [Spirochaetaceae bacterium]|jgi:acyl-CoA thioester hydrolase|nr:acyl-CoA thioesterase [Spirochaetaceae bacterium]